MSLGQKKSFNQRTIQSDPYFPLGSINKKLLPRLPDLVIKGVEGLSKSVKKGTFVTKILFPDIVERSSKNLRKVIPANKNKNIWWLYLTNFHKKYLQNLKCNNVKKVCIFHLILVGILSILPLSIKNRGGSLNGQNLLSVTKVICRQSLTIILMIFTKNFLFDFICVFYQILFKIKYGLISASVSEDSFEYY